MRGYKRGQDEERHSRVAEVCLIDLDRRGDLVEFDVLCDHARYASCGEREGKEGGKVGIVNAVCSPTLRFRDNRVRIHSLPPPAPPPVGGNPIRVPVQDLKYTCQYYAKPPSLVSRHTEFTSAERDVRHAPSAVGSAGRGAPTGVERVSDKRRESDARVSRRVRNDRVAVTPSETRAYRYVFQNDVFDVVRLTRLTVGVGDRVQDELPTSAHNITKRRRTSSWYCPREPNAIPVPPVQVIFFAKMFVEFCQQWVQVKTSKPMVRVEIPGASDPRSRKRSVDAPP